MTLDELLGPIEVAALLGVKPNTIAQWRRRHAFPAPLVVLSGTALWDRSVVLAWAERSGHPGKPGRPPVGG